MKRALFGLGRLALGVLWFRRGFCLVRVIVPAVGQFSARGDIENLRFLGGVIAIRRNQFCFLFTHSVGSYKKTRHEAGRLILRSVKSPAGEAQPLRRQKRITRSK